MNISVRRRTWLQRFLAWLLPERIRRLMFVASLATFIKGTVDLDEETLERLNVAFDLCTLKSALKFPMFISPVIWSGLRMGESSDASFKDHVKFITPCWLRYDTDKLDSDLDKLVNHSVL